MHSTLLAAGIPPEDWSPYLIQLLGVRGGAHRPAGLSPESMKTMTITALNHSVTQASRQAPLVIAVEDMQL